METNRAACFHKTHHHVNLNEKLDGAKGKPELPLLLTPHGCYRIESGRKCMSLELHLMGPYFFGK